MNSDLVTLGHESEQHQIFGSDVEFWQENAYTFVGTSNGMDFMLYTRVCIISGQENRLVAAQRAPSGAHH